jgi:uncharacterized membrane protein YedE/YeeE
MSPSIAAGASLTNALAIGFAFGFALERAGLGSARKLSGLFDFSDFMVVKVMFSAIVTAMLGLFVLGGLGIVDLARISVPKTYLVPQLAGGLLFGAGFLVAGLCPGTACVSAATGSGDGAAAMAGVFTGVLAASLAAVPFRGLYESTPRGALTLPGLLDVPAGLVVAGIAAVALLGFRGVEWVERRR